jgi:hypothetical protein
MVVTWKEVTLKARSIPAWAEGPPYAFVVGYRSGFQPSIVITIDFLGLRPRLV